MVVVSNRAEISWKNDCRFLLVFLCVIGTDCVYEIAKRNEGGRQEYERNIVRIVSVCV